jgi:hypothetical protein
VVPEQGASRVSNSKSMPSYISLYTQPTDAHAHTMLSPSIMMTKKNRLTAADGDGDG